MNTIQIYDINNKNDDFQMLIDKLKSVGAQIYRYDLKSNTDELSKNFKIKRLWDAYGETILPITMINGEIVKLEENLSYEQVIRQSELSMKKIMQAGIEIKNNSCCSNNKCGGCAHKNAGCGSCQKQCCKH